MCNLYNMAPKEDIELYFRAIVWGGYVHKTVGPRGSGAFLKPNADALQLVEGQWAMIPKGCPTRVPAVPPKVPGGKPIPLSTNNARLETISKARTFAPSWKAGQRCLIPATWYQEPNWQTGKNIWWQLRRADGLPWALAGLWSEWTDLETGEVVANYTMITRNCDSHPMLNRLHKPDAYFGRVCTLVSLRADHPLRRQMNNDADNMSKVPPPPTRRRHRDQDLSTLQTTASAPAACASTRPSTEHDVHCGPLGQEWRRPPLDLETARATDRSGTGW